ncbi:unnamed protein product [Caenorhabditis bovis]|uniref:Uncharacterized protein n=1 Tax=Caenorhabditis bovis TaxID=2654633 RepID=A0A8S1EJ74_9PELO|nr:unnamed protein product [Caenorhabditis bovis]
MANYHAMINKRYEAICETLEGPRRLTFQISHTAQYYAQNVHREESNAEKKRLMRDLSKKLYEFVRGSERWTEKKCWKFLKKFVDLEQKIDDCSASEKIVRRRQLMVDIALNKKNAGFISSDDDSVIDEVSDESSDVEFDESDKENIDSVTKKIEPLKLNEEYSESEEYSIMSDSEMNNQKCE